MTQPCAAPMTSVPPAMATQFGEESGVGGREAASRRRRAAISRRATRLISVVAGIVAGLIPALIPALGTRVAIGQVVASAPRKTPRVLVLYSQRRELPINEQWERGIREGIEANLGTPVAIDSEFLDFHRLEKSDERQAMLDLVLSKYQGLKPDVVIPVSDAIAGPFVRRNPFGDTAVVFCSILEETRARLPIQPNMTGVYYRFAARRTVQCARQLIPTTRTAIVISGTGEQDLYLLERIKADLADETETKCEYWTGIPISELSERVSRLPSSHVILFNSYMRDRGGEIATVPRDVLMRISATSSVPVFALYDTMMGSGVVGGCMVPVDEQGRLAGDMAGKILKGEPPGSIPFSGTSMTRFIFDARQLKRFGIHESTLPAGSILLFRKPTLWEEYRGYVMFGVTVLLLQSLLITGLLVNRRSRLQVQRELSTRLEFETLLSELSSRLIERKPGDMQGEIESALKRISEHLCLDRATVYLLSESGQELAPFVFSARPGEAAPPEAIALNSIPWFWARLSRGQAFQFASLADWPPEAVQDKEVISNLGVKAGVAVALSITGEVFGILALGHFKRVRRWEPAVLQRLSLVAEIISNAVARTRIEAELAASRSQAKSLAGRILTAQEDERKRIARELHDDFSQRLAAAAIEADKSERETTTPLASKSAFKSLKEHLIALSDDVRRLSRQLHPAILEDLGLRDALHNECDRVAKLTGVTVEFRCGTLPARVPKDISLCIYRVAQEALGNAVKHSQANRLEVILNADLEFIYLDVRDNGCGFDSSDARRQSGLGLASMEERVRLVGGELTTVSALDEGTSIRACIPLPDEYTGETAHEPSQDPDGR